MGEGSAREALFAVSVVKCFEFSDFVWVLSAAIRVAGRSRAVMRKERIMAS